jgi:hypothetical protein
VACIIGCMYMIEFKAFLFFGNASYCCSVLMHSGLASETSAELSWMFPLVAFSAAHLDTRDTEACASTLLFPEPACSSTYPASLGVQLQTSLLYRHTHSKTLATFSVVQQDTCRDHDTPWQQQVLVTSTHSPEIIHVCIMATFTLTQRTTVMPSDLSYSYAHQTDSHTSWSVPCTEEIVR